MSRIILCSTRAKQAFAGRTCLLPAPSGAFRSLYRQKLRAGLAPALKVHSIYHRSYYNTAISKMQAFIGSSDLFFRLFSVFSSVFSSAVFRFFSPSLIGSLSLCLRVLQAEAGSARAFCPYNRQRNPGCSREGTPRSPHHRQKA